MKLGSPPRLFQAPHPDPFSLSFSRVCFCLAREESRVFASGTLRAAATREGDKGGPSPGSRSYNEKERLTTLPWQMGGESQADIVGGPAALLVAQYQPQHLDYLVARDSTPFRRQE
jgi:hypothetical protein